MSVLLSVTFEIETQTKKTVKITSLKLRVNADLVLNVCGCV